MLSRSLRDPNSMAMIVIEHRTKVETGDRVWHPRVTGVRLFMDIHMCARRGKWGAVVIEGAMDLRIGGELRIDAGAMEKVEGNERMGQESVPEV